MAGTVGVIADHAAAAHGNSFRSGKVSHRLRHRRHDCIVHVVLVLVELSRR